MAQNQGRVQPMKKGRPRRQWWTPWTDYHQDVRYLQIDYDVREREKQILKIVDDNGFKFWIFFVAASGFLASSYSLFATNVVTPSLYYVYPPCSRLGSSASEIIDLATLAGTVLGMVLVGHLADRSGRSRLYGLELGILIVATMGVVQASEGFMGENPDGTTVHSMDIYAWICWWRITLGFGIGAEYPLSAVVTAEWASTESRGTMLAAVFSMQSVGRLLAFATNLGAIRDSNLASTAAGSSAFKVAVDKAWRLTIGVGVIPAAFAILLRFTIPETPRYYADIMRDLRKAVKNALKVYGRTRKVITEEEQRSVASGPLSRQNSDDDADRWFHGAWNYLTGPKKAWRNLVAMSLLWGIMDAAWYGLSMDSPSALATLAHDPADNSTLYGFDRRQTADSNGTATTNGCSKNLWNTDTWEPYAVITDVLEENALRSIVVVSVASFAGSMAALLVINRFRRRTILASTFLLLGVLFAAAGASLLAAGEAARGRLAATVFYAVLQFLFNLAPNTLTFVLAAEIFPTVYRGTFYGVAAAAGKLGAIVIRAIVAATTNSAASLGARLLAFVPLMAIAAALSLVFPDVQVVPRRRGGGAGGADAEGLVLEGVGERSLRRRKLGKLRVVELKAPPSPQQLPQDVQSAALMGGQQQQQLQAAGYGGAGQREGQSPSPSSPQQQEQQPQQHGLSDSDSSDDEFEDDDDAAARRASGPALPRFSFLGRLKNKTLEEIAPNPAWERVRGGSTGSQGGSGGAAGAAGAGV